MKKFFNRIAGPLAVAGFGLLLLAESKRPLRKARSNKLRRIKTNAGVAAVTAIAIRLFFLPVVAATARRVEKKKIGLLNTVRLPRPVKFAVAVILLDYTFYWWHWMMHRLDFFWRFHMVHHTDIDLDVSTAARFHFGEYLLSTGYRAGQVIVIGAGPLAASVFEAAIMLAAEFHHSNLRLPFDFERRLNAYIVTPRMHGIHHSIIERETGSDFGTILTAWDRLHGTLRLNVPQDQITIGLPMYRDERELTFLRLLEMPFSERRKLRLILEGSYPDRKQLPDPETEMAE